MRFLMVLACAVIVASTAFAADHGPVFSYATPVNSEREFSFDTGIFGRYGSRGTQLSTGSGFGYGVTPHITINASLPASFGSGNLPESRIISGTEWFAGASWRFLHSVTSVGKRIESTASLGLVVPGPQQESGVLGSLHRAPGIAGTHRYGYGLPQSVRVGWGRLYPLCRGIERQTTGHALLECRLRLSASQPPPWIRPMGLSRLC
jgi:hypothetical protein